MAFGLANKLFVHGFGFIKSIQIIINAHIRNKKDTVQQMLGSMGIPMKVAELD